MSKTKSPSALYADHKWYILRGGFLPQGRKISGGFSTRDDALEARAVVERFSGGETFWIDSESPSVVSAAP